MVHLVFTKHSEKALQLAPIIAMLEELDIKPDDHLAAIYSGGALWPISLETDFTKLLLTAQ